MKDKLLLVLASIFADIYIIAGLAAVIWIFLLGLDVLLFFVIEQSKLSIVTVPEQSIWIAFIV